MPIPFYRRIKKFNPDPWPEAKQQELIAAVMEGKTLYQMTQLFGKNNYFVIMELHRLSGVSSPIDQDRIDEKYGDKSKTNRELHNLKNSTWLPLEDKRLVQEFNNGANILKLADSMGRSMEAIYKRINYLLDESREHRESMFNHACLMVRVKE